ncbi:MAG: YggT family protein [Nakamurella sp.]
MPVVLVLLSVLLLIFQLVLVARILVDLVPVLAGPRGRAPGLRRARAGVYRVTEPVLVPVRRVLRPVRVGSVHFDLAMPAVLIAVILLRSLLPW